jgi:hypothetical protein
MEETKIINRICPKCGELYQTKEIAKVTLGGGAQINMSCENGHKWSEFYSLTYQGYWWSGKRYDSYSEEIPNEKLI